MHQDDAAELSHIFAQIQASRNVDACRELWNAVNTRLLIIARTRLAGQHRRAVDEEDVALSAINSFVHAAEAGRLIRFTGETICGVC